MNSVVFLLIFNLTNGQAHVEQMPTIGICEAAKASVLKTMHLNAKDGAQYNAMCLEGKVFVAKRGEA